MFAWANDIVEDFITRLDTWTWQRLHGNAANERRLANGGDCIEGPTPEIASQDERMHRL